MFPLLLGLALMLPGRVADPGELHHRGYDPTHQGLDVDGWLRRTPEGRPDLPRTALDIRHNGLLRGAAAGLGWSLLLLALARRRGWARTPWRAEGLPGSAIHNGTKAIHLGAWAGAMGLGFAILNGVGEHVERDQSRLPEPFLLAGEALFLLGVAGAWVRRLDKNRQLGPIHRARRLFDAIVASPPLDTPSAPPASRPLPEGFAPSALERRVRQDWDGFRAAWEARDLAPMAHRMTDGWDELLRTRQQALAALERPDRHEGAALEKAAFVHLHEDASGASATLRLSLRGPSRPGGGAPAWTEMWTLVRDESNGIPTGELVDELGPRPDGPPEAPGDRRPVPPDREAPPRPGSRDWLVASIVPESEWAPPDPQRLERLAPLLRNDPRDTFRHLEDVALGAFARRVRARNEAATATRGAERAPGPALPAPIAPLVLAVDAMTSESHETESVAWVAVAWLVDLPSTDPEADVPRRTLLRLARPTAGDSGPVGEPGPREPATTHVGSRSAWTITGISGDDLLEPPG